MDMTRRGVLTAGLVAGTTLPGILETDGAQASPHHVSEMEKRAESLSPPIFLLETRVPKQFHTDDRSQLSISDAHAKVGRHSLRWEHGAGSALTVSEPMHVSPSAYSPGDDQAHMGTVDTFCIWVHNDEPSDTPLRIEFGRGANRDCWFDFGLDFTGWRTCWVRLGYDTEGTARHGMNRVRFVAPDRSGTLHLDQVILNVPMRPDHPTPDDQVPAVQPEIADADNHHWLALRQFRSDLRKHPLPEAPEGSDVSEIRARLLESLAGRPEITQDALDALTATVDKLGVPELDDDGALSGPGSFVNGYQNAIWPEELREDLADFASLIELRKLTDTMLAVAQAAHAARGKKAATASGFDTLYLRLFAHLEDQGFAAGSAQGTIHHIGYQYRGFADSLLLVQPLLEHKGLWDRACENLGWFFGAGRLTQDFSDAAHYGGVVDVLNTLLQGLVIYGLTRPQARDQARYVAGVTRWVDHALTHSPGIEGGFKPDGTTFHHMGPYPDYARDAFAGMSPVVALLAGTGFALSRSARSVLRTALLTQRLHANTTEWPLALSGRHPTGETALNVPTFQRLAGVAPAEAEQDSSTHDYDNDVASAFLRLLPAQPSNSQKAFAEELREHGIAEEEAPNGHWELGYAACGLHRRDEWLVTLRGHNRYLWATEIYDGANLYGRYSTYGTIEIQAASDKTGAITHAANGYEQPGWDWNRFPGATTRHLPWKQLEADLSGTIEQMVLTQSAFAGAGSWRGRHGIFGMHLMEHPYFDPTHTAKISRFSFDDVVIALGSDIRNSDGAHETETTLFQVRRPDGTDADRDSSRDLEEGTTIVDPVGNGFYVAGEQTLRLIDAVQSAPDQSGEKSADAAFSTALLRHGSAPDQGDYEYAILVQSGKKKAHDFARRMATDHAPYTVERKDGRAHVVRHRDSGIRASVCFSSVDALDGTVTGVDAPCLLMEHRDGESLHLSVTDPDLHLYEGKDPDQFAEDGTYTGRMTSFSRPWKRNESKKSVLTLTLAGRWTCDQDGVRATHSHDRTTLRVTCRHAASRNLGLARQS